MSSEFHNGFVGAIVARGLDSLPVARQQIPHGANTAITQTITTPDPATETDTESRHGAITMSTESPTAAPVLITGDTYPHREALKAMGGRWDALARGWRVPAARAAEARALVPAVAPSRSYSRPGPSEYRGYRRGGVCQNPRDCGDPTCRGECGY